MVWPVQQSTSHFTLLSMTTKSDIMQIPSERISEIFIAVLLHYFLAFRCLYCLTYLSLLYRGTPSFLNNYSTKTFLQLRRIRPGTLFAEKTSLYSKPLFTLVKDVPLSFGHKGFYILTRFFQSMKI